MRLLVKPDTFPRKPKVGTPGLTAETKVLANRAMETLPKCAVPSCNRRVETIKHEFCGPCGEARHSYQLKINTKLWRERKKSGEAGNRIWYGGKPTQWALDNPTEAIRLAVKEGYDNEVLERLIKAAALTLLSK